MITLQSLWRELTGAPKGVSNSGYLLRLVGTYSGCRCYAALRMPDGQKSLILGVHEGALSSRDMTADSAAFRCFIAKIDGLGDGQVGIVLTLNDVNYEDLFVLLLEDIIVTAKKESSANKAVISIFRTIERWRRFIERMALGTLSDEEVQGLIGEIAILARLVLVHGERSAVMSWIGPNNAIHDFAIGGIELEVKAHQGNPAGGVWINDLAQLQPDATDSLYLVVPSVTPAGSAGFTLPQFVQQLKDILGSDTAVEELFSMKLATVGYLDSLANHYLRRYVIGDVSAFRVGDGFPTIAPCMVPSAVDKVRYRLRLAPLEPWRMDVRAIIGLGIAPWGTI